MEGCYGVGWLDNGEFLNEYNFDNLKLANSVKNFSDFTKNLNASMVEVIEKSEKIWGLINIITTNFKHIILTCFMHWID